MTNMSSIHTLVKDIENLILKGKKDIVGEADKLGVEVASNYRDKLLARRDQDEKRTLRMSNLGVPCERKLWFSIHQRDKGEPYPANTILKFNYGDYIESLLLRLAQEAGHDVRGEQDEMEINGIKGHRDCVIDGVTIDVKSASTYSFKKFRDGLTPDKDAFGYIPQLKSYIYAGRDDPLVTKKTTGGFLVVDKQHGHIHLDIHEFTQEEINDVPSIVEHKKDVVSSEEVPPRGFDPVPEGSSGNMRLGTNCSYCEFKHHCHPGLRTFIYSNGPKYLTTVKKLPKVYEAE